MISHMVIVWKTIGEKQLCDGDSGGSGAVYHHAAVLFLFPGHLQRIDDAGKDDDGGAVLVVMEHRNVQQLF